MIIIKKVGLTATLLICLFSCIFTVASSSTITALEESWGYSLLGTNYFKEKITNLNKEEIVIAVLDTGIDTNHPWFKDRIKEGGAHCLNNSKQCLTGGYQDDEGHGTFVSGIIAKGTTDNVKILPIKVLESDGYGNVMDFYNGIQYVIKLKNQGMNIKAINFSISGDNRPLGSYYSNIYKKAFSDAYNAGILSIVSAGNNAKNLINTGPANLDKEVITVSSLSRYKTDDNTIELVFSKHFSNYGSTVDFIAPGDDIISAKIGGGIENRMGTSYSAAHVSSYIGLLYSVCNNCTPQIIEQVMIDSVITAGIIEKNDYYGYGIISMYSAYDNIIKAVQHVYKITTNQIGRGKININNNDINIGENATITFTPEQNYKVSKIIVDGIALSKNELNQAIKYGYTFKNINTNHTIEVIFSFQGVSTSPTIPCIVDIAYKPNIVQNCK